MAAKLYCLFIFITLNKNFNPKLFENLREGLNKALIVSNTKLAGGDLCSSNGPISFSVTVVGEANRKHILKRNGASNLSCFGYWKYRRCKNRLDILIKE